VENPETEALHHHQTGRPWIDLLLGVSAVLISFISLFLAIANGRAMERLVQSNSWPFVQASTSNVNPDGSPHISLSIANKGVGPARLETLEVMYNGNPMSSPRALVDAMLGRATDRQHPVIITANVIHGVLAAKESISYVDLKPETLSAEDYAAINVGLQTNKLGFLICYCSVFDECWIRESGKTRPSKVKECPASSGSF
jgi:hypothetical protein